MWGCERGGSEEERMDKILLVGKEVGSGEKEGEKKKGEVVTYIATSWRGRRE